MVPDSDVSHEHPPVEQVLPGAFLVVQTAEEHEVGVARHRVQAEARQGVHDPVALHLDRVDGRQQRAGVRESGARRGLGQGRQVVRQPHQPQRVADGGGRGEVAEPGTGEREGLAHGAGDDQTWPVGEHGQRRYGALSGELGVRLVNHHHAARGLRGRDHDVPTQRRAGGVVGRAQEHDIGVDVVFLCSPNNPTGTALRRDVVIAASQAARGMVVVDEAYAEFAREGAVSALSVLPDRPRLVVTRTMSKAFTFAGARLGYLAAAPAVCDALRLVRLPYHLSSLTQAAARAALAHAGALLSTVDAIKMQRDRLVDALPRLGLHPVPSDANFVLFGGLDDEKRTWQDLLDRGVLVRDVGIRHHLRVTAGTPDETTAFLDALADTRGATS